MSDRSSGERIVLTKWSPLLAAGVLFVAASLWVVPLLGLILVPRSRTEAITFGVLTAVMAIPFLWVVWRIPATVRGMGIAVDDIGIHPFNGNRTDTIAWPEIAGVGFGSYAGSNRGMTTKSRQGLEIYLTHADHAARHSRLRGDWQSVDPPAAGYSAGCFRYTVSPFGKDAERLERAVRRYRPGLWSGPFLHGR